jgi:hypothetical protein
MAKLKRLLDGFFHQERRRSFQLKPVQSSIPGAGKGSEFICSGNETGLGIAGNAAKGSFLCYYPGVLYNPGDPMLFQSLRNDYILSLVRKLSNF